MSSIGRTRYTSSKLFTWCMGLAALTCATLYASKTLEEITKHGPITVDSAQFSALLKTTFHSAQVDDIEVSIAENRLVEQIEEASAQVIPTPKALMPAKTKRVAKKKVAAAREVLPVVVIEKNSEKLVEVAPTETKAPPIAEVDPAIDALKTTQSITTSSLDEIPAEPTHSEGPPPMNPAPVVLGSLLSLPTSEEEKAMQEIHAALRNRFYVAIQNVEMNIQPLMIVETAIEPVPELVLNDVSETIEAATIQSYIDQGATVIDDEIAPIPAQVIEVSPEPKAVEETKVVEAPAAAPTLEEKIEILSTTSLDAVPEMSIQPVNEPLVKAAAPAEKQMNTQPDVKVAAEVKNKATKSTLILDAIPEEPKAAAAPPAIVAKNESLPKVAQTTQMAYVKKSAPVKAPSADELTSYEEDIRSAMVSHDEEEDEYSVETRQSAPVRQVVKSNRLIRPKPSLLDATTQRKTPAVAGVEQDSNGITIAWSKSSSTMGADKMIASTASAGVSVNDASSLPEIKKSCDTALIGRGAFLPVTSETLSVCRRALSLEGISSGSQSRWWEVKEGTNSWPTLIWQDPKIAFTRENRIPMLSNNSVKLLSVIARSEVQSSAGIVFGEIPGGLELQLSGRSEQVIFFDQNLKTVDARDVSRTRFFAFLNVAPGNPLLFISLRGGAKGGAIPLLVKAGQATYIRVPLPQLKTIQANVYDAGARAAQGVSSLSVQIVGQDGKTAVTDTKGSFEIREVVVFGDYATYLDVAPNEKSFKHRYRIRADELRGKSLFYFRDASVSHWISQLEGGVSPFSGLVVGAIPSVMNEKKASIRIGSLAKKDSLTPEAYVLGAGDALIDHQKLGNGNIRFIGVQIPEGPHFPAAFDHTGEMLWSELVISQPGVINVVGP